MNESKKILDKFLFDNKRKPDKEHTHTAIPNYPESYGGSYTIPDNKYNQFLNLYYNSVFRDDNTAYLTEKHVAFSPILIDLDFRFPIDTKSRKYDDKFITDFMDIYIDELKKILDLTKTNIEAFVLEKKKIKINEEKQIVKDGIHIMIPNILTIPKTQYIMRYRMINNPKVQELLNKLDITNTIEDVIDICVIEKNNWQMYGSTKPNCEPYKVTQIYDYSKSKYNKLDVDIYNDKALLKILSIRNKDKKNIQIIREEEIDSFETDYSEMPTDHKIRKQKKTILTKKKKSPSNININETTNLDKIEKLVDMLDIKRVEDYTLWLQLGWCLHNIDDRLLKTWIKFSKKSSKFKHGECENEWDYMDNEGLSIGTLHLWAKEDNFGKFKELMSNDLRTYINKGLSGTPYDVAMVLYQLYKNEFIYANRKVWYQFINHRWVTLNEAMALKQRLSKDLHKEYQTHRHSISSKQDKLDDDDPERETLEKDIDKCKAIMMKLKITSFKKNVLEECQELFYKDKFENELDNNPYLIGFDNGVYDLRIGKFRAGIPEDYLTYTTGINYEDFDEEDMCIQEVRTFIHQVLPVADVREYMLTLLSSFLDGKITGQKFHIWTGSGSNGKSKLIELFQNSFGEYCGTFPSSLITQKRTAAESCNPVLVRAKGKRFVVLQEPEVNERINVGLMKELTGGDKIIARGLHKDPIEYTPQFKLVLTCNDLPQVPSNDDGTWRRMRCVKFPSKFTYEPSSSNPFEFDIDENLSEKLAQWPGAFMYILLNYYKIYIKKGLFEPASVKEHTQAYKNKSDQFSQFFGEKIKEAESGSNQNIHIDEAYYTFQEWFKLAYGNVRPPSRKELQTNM
jgi:P4 family phage/plasmid primase-like protien